MKLSKKALTAMLAVSIAATALPAAAMVSNLTNTLTSGNSADANNAAPQAAPAPATPAVQADPSPVETFAYQEIDADGDSVNDAVNITGFNIDEGSTAAIVVPPTINELPVVSLSNNNAPLTNATRVSSIDLSAVTTLKSIGVMAFYNIDDINEVLTSVIFPTGENVAYTIGISAFTRCSGITGSIDLSGCTSIGNSAFQQCNSITGSINLSNCNQIKSSAFQDCTSITSVTWSNSMTDIPDSCFWRCRKLNTFNSSTPGVIDLSKITSIGDNAFGLCFQSNPNNDNRISIVFPTDHPYTIGESAFENCAGLNSSVNLSACTSVGTKAFYGCTGITGAIDLSSCNSIGVKAFYQLPNISSVAFPTDHPYTIGESAFEDCAGLKSSVNLSACTSIGNNAFKNSAITDAIDLSACTSVGEFAFADCSNIISVTWPTDKMQEIPAQCFSGCISLKNFNNDTGFNLAGITSIANYAFTDSTGISGSIDLSDCKSIGDGAFQTCSSIASVTWPVDTMPTIPYACFANCTSLKYFNSNTELDLKGITSIGEASFKQVGAAPVITPSAEMIEKEAFQDVPYVVIKAENETALQTYCAGITSEWDDPLVGLTTVKKVATFSDSASSDISISLSDLANLADENATYYAVLGDFAGTLPDGYTSLNSCRASIKNIPNGTSTVTDATGTVPVRITSNEYNPAYSYYFSVDGATSPNAVTPTDNNGAYTYTQEVALGASGSDIALIRQIAVTGIEITGPDSVQYSQNGTVEFSGTVTPDDALNKDITWSSSDPNVLKFEDENSGTATIVGTGTATVKATAADGLGGTGTKVVSVTPATGVGYIIDYPSETIQVVDGYQVSRDTDFATLLQTGDAIYPEETVYVRTVGTTAATENKIDARPAAPTVPPEVQQNINIIQVTNPADNQQYMLTKDSTALSEWQNSPVFTDTSLKAGDTYTVATRYKATDTAFASNEISTSYTANEVPSNGVRLDGGSTGSNWTNKTNPEDTTIYNAETPYEIPLYIQTTGGDVYQVEIDWGNMLFSYNFGTWDTETLSYDDPSQQGWTTSFDAVNNQVTVLNRSSKPINATLEMEIDAGKQAELEHLGFHLTTNNKNSEDSSDYYPTEAQTLQSGSTGNSTTAYVNIKSDDTKPDDSIAEKYNQVDGTQIGNITVTVQKTGD